MTGAQASEPPIVVAVGAASDTGLRRRVNEDAFLAQAPLFLVADGMGGHDAGDRASAAVVAEFAAFVGRESLTIDQVRAALRRARTRVGAIGSAGRAAGTTLTGVVVAEVGGAGYWLTVNVGDSRTYRYAHGVLEQISVDHSVVQELIDAGELPAEAAASDRRRNEITRAIGAGSDGQADYWMVPAEAAASDRRRNEITRAIGAGSDGQADYWMVPAEPGDRILVCSDGLSGEVSAERLRTVLEDETDPQDAATRLIHEALLQGGRDNITAVVVDALAVAGTDDLYDTAPAGGRTLPDEDTRPRAGAGGSRR